jgi:hypothetical protein
VCMDETPKQLIKEVHKPLSMKPGFEKKVDYEYSRSVVCNVFMINEPLAGKRFTKVTNQHTKKDWAILVRYICDKLYPDAETISLVMDNLASHTVLLHYMRPLNQLRQKEFGIVWNLFTHPNMVVG